MNNFDEQFPCQTQIHTINYWFKLLLKLLPMYNGAFSFNKRNFGLNGENEVFDRSVLYSQLYIVHLGMFAKNS